jgi:dihydrofolate reductase
VDGAGIHTDAPIPDAADRPAITFLSTDLRGAGATAIGAASGRNVVVFGASLAQRCMRAGLLDEIVIHLVPVLLGDGVRLIDSPDLARGGSPSW